MPLIQNLGRKVGDKRMARKLEIPDAWDKDGKMVVDDKGKVKVKTIMPGAHVKVTDEQFRHLRELFGNEIINIDDIREMQETTDSESDKPKERPAGYLSPQEVDELVARKVAEAKAVHAGARSEYTIDSLEAMDRPDLIAVIETENLDIEAKNYKAPDTLKKAVISGLVDKGYLAE